MDRSMYEPADTGETNEGGDKAHVIEVNPDGILPGDDNRNIDFGSIMVPVPHTVEDTEELTGDNSAVVQEFDPLASSSEYRDQRGDDTLDDDISSLDQGPVIDAGDQILQSGPQEKDPDEEEDEDF